MSTKYPGGLITKTPVTPTGPYQNGTAPGVWTVEQALQYTKQGIWPTAGNQDPTNIYIEYLFSTYLYTGNGSTQTITNGINLSANGGLVWTKDRTSAISNELTDTVRGAGLRLISNTTSAQGGAGSSDTTSFTTTGFGLTYNNGGGNLNGENYVSWTFRKQAKFFDIVTFTGNGVAGRTIAHNLGSVPGCIILKSISEAGVNWNVFHRSIAPTGTLRLNTTDAQTSGLIEYYFGNDTAYVAPTSTVFTVGGSSAGNQVNGSGVTYVAYLFAHDAGGFGASGTENVISCGGFTHAGANAVQTLGYEPQFLLIKKVNDVGDWKIVDTMRGWSVAGPDLNLYPNTSGAEVDSGMYNPVATGFDWGQNGTFIYIAIRRGPMQTPTVGTSVFTPQTWTGTGTNSRVFTGSGFPLDVLMIGSRDAVQFASYWFTDRLQGASPHLQTASTSAAFNTTSYFVSKLDSMDGYVGGTLDYDQANNSGSTRVQYFFRRAPGFLDEVCYIGTGANTTVTHNLGVVPEMMIVKNRSVTGAWNVYTPTTGNTSFLELNTAYSQVTNSGTWNNTSPTSSVFTVGTASATNGSGNNLVAYLFATCAGVSKVGSYTGTGAAQTINCGFTSGARFVLIKRVNVDNYDWYVWDSARGIIPSNDPYLLLNSTAAEVTGTDYVDTTSVGFDITSTAPAAINANGGTYIFLAIA